MDPNILKSLQKIDELVKAKKDLLIVKASADEQSSLNKPLAFPQPSAQPNNININNNKNKFSDGIVVPTLLEENKGGDQKKNEKKPEKKLSYIEKEMIMKEKRKKVKTLRKIAGEVWEDKTLEDWPDNDYRIFCGDLGNEVNDEVLGMAFRKYPSFQRARVIRDKKSGKTKGFGFVSLMDPQDFLKALNEMNGKYVGNRPIKVKKSSWKDRALFGGKFSNDRKMKKIKL